MIQFDGVVKKVTRGEAANDCGLVISSRSGSIMSYLGPIDNVHPGDFVTVSITSTPAPRTPSVCG